MMVDNIAFHFKCEWNVKIRSITYFGDDDTAWDDTAAISGVFAICYVYPRICNVHGCFESVKYDLTAGVDVVNRLWL